MNKNAYLKVDIILIEFITDTNSSIEYTIKEPNYKVFDSNIGSVTFPKKIGDISVIKMKDYGLKIKWCCENLHVAANSIWINISNLKLYENTLIYNYTKYAGTQSITIKPICDRVVNLTNISASDNIKPNLT